MGFASLLKSVGVGEKCGRDALRRLEHFLETEVFKGAFPWRYDAQLFSDTVVITLPFPAESGSNSNIVYELPFHIGVLQCKFLMAGFLVRGAVAAGRWVKGRIIKSSPIYAPLYESESKFAVVPRIIYGLDDDLAQIADDHFYSAESAGLSGFDASIATATDYDHRTFVDYLACAAFGLTSDHMVLESHKALIEAGIQLNLSRKSVLQKYLWMASYHNHVVKSKWLEEHFCSLELDDLSELQVNLGNFPKGLKFPLRKASSDCPFYFNWDRFYQFDE